jgi:hypothetical protein
MIPYLSQKELGVIFLPALQGLDGRDVLQQWRLERVLNPSRASQTMQR